MSAITLPQELADLLHLVQDTGETTTDRGRLIRADGTTVPVLIAGVPRLEDSRPAVKKTAVDTDLASTTRIATVLHERDDMYRQIVEQSIAGICVIDENGNIIEWNRALEQLTDLSREQVIGQPVWEIRSLLAPPEHQTREHLAAARSALLDALRTGRSPQFGRQVEGIFHRQDGQRRLFREFAFPIKREKGYWVGSAMQDVTDAQRLESLGILASGIAHDFNNLLLVISGNARLAAAALEPDHPACAHLSEIVKAASHASDLARGALDIGRPLKEKDEVVRFSTVLAEARGLLQSVLSIGIHLSVDCASDTPAIRCNPTHIRCILVNLVTNATQAIGSQGGRIEIRADSVSIAAGEAHAAPALHAGCYARLTVSDTGRGMDQDTLQHIFDPYFTTKPAGQGTGLGLSIVRGLVMDHGGAIDVDSQPGQGTTFRLYFPATEGAPPAAAGQPAQPARGQGGKVVYVDDNGGVVLLIQRVLRRLGYDVTSDTDPVHVLDTIREQPRAFDIVVTDLAMPGINGIDFARHVRAIRPDMPIVLTTGYTKAADREALQHIGGCELILKPDSFDEIGAVLDRLLRQPSANG